LLGNNLGGLPAYRRSRLGIGLVQENRRIFRRRTVVENLRLGGFWRHRNRRQLQKAILREYERFPVLGNKRRAPAATLSGGEQQMLAIAQALIAEPIALLLDEPLGSLSPAVAREVLATLEQLRRDGMAILLVEQALDQALRIADQVVVLDLGTVVLSKPSSAVVGAAEIAKVYLGTSV
jgi:branched-chain amino acid transport system ATP-binding protein